MKGVFVCLPEENNVISVLKSSTLIFEREDMETSKVGSVALHLAN